MWTQIFNFSHLCVLVFSASFDLSLHLNAFCGEKADGNYFYPNYCHAFITCSNRVGFLYKCNPLDLVYEETRDSCGWPSETFICTAEKVARESASLTSTSSQLSTTSITTPSPIPEQSTEKHTTSVSDSKLTSTDIHAIKSIPVSTYKQTSAYTYYFVTTHLTDTQTSSISTGQAFIPQSTTEASSTSERVTPFLTTVPKSVTGTTCNCDCSLQEKIDFWNNETNQRLHLQQLPKRLSELKRILAMNKSELTSEKAKLISAPDNRPSAQAVGSLGVVLIFVLLSFIIVLDLMGVCQRSQLCRFKFSNMKLSGE